MTFGVGNMCACILSCKQCGACCQHPHLPGCAAADISAPLVLPTPAVAPVPGGAHCDRCGYRGVDWSGHVVCEARCPGCGEDCGGRCAHG